MFGLLPKGAIQYPHRHESVALDFVISCKPGCYTMIGTELGPDGMIINGHREDWKPGASFITPAGYWHSHHNESGGTPTSSQSRTPVCTPTCGHSTSFTATPTTIGRHTYPRSPEDKGHPACCAVGIESSHAGHLTTDDHRFTPGSAEPGT